MMLKKCLIALLYSINAMGTGATMPLPRPWGPGTQPWDGADLERFAFEQVPVR